MKLLFPFLLTLASCAGIFSGKPHEGKTIYSYVDETGKFKLQRETKTIQKKLVTRYQLFDTKGSASRVVEKSILVSQVGSIKAKDTRVMTVRPLASEFVTWLEGKKYSTKMQLDTATKSMKVTLDSPESKWKGTQLIKFPSGKYFCFYNQIPECLYHNYFLNLAREREETLDFYVVWDAWPFIQEQLNRVGQQLFVPATLKFDGENNGLFRYIVEVEGQMILFHFSKSFDLVKVAWISQGITIAPPGQEIVEEDE